MPDEKSLHEIIAAAEELCEQTGYEWIGDEDQRMTASVVAAVRNGEKLDGLGKKLDGLTDAFTRLAAAIEESNELTRRALDDPRGVKKLKVGDKTP